MISGRTPCSDTQCNYHNYPSNSFINNYLVVTPRGEEKGERRGGGTARPQKGGGRHLLAPARTAYPRRAFGGGGPPRLDGGPTKVT